jgi:hypothetical protein
MFSTWMPMPPAARYRWASCSSSVSRSTGAEGSVTKIWVKRGHLAFFATRASLQGVAIQTLITRVAPRLATVLGQKLAAQTAPVLGAVAGAATNYAYTSYYQQIAHVHFRIRALGIEADRPEEELREALRQRVSLPGL